MFFILLPLLPRFLIAPFLVPDIAAAFHFLYVEQSEMKKVRFISAI